ncbi:unnamed protein product [Acanthoscelides obtectus]|uniref:Reverse transcriptase domain-containing protein n=1 Tax=Acanthoscelides obtectus TaxID=200917 RepID=A0A9P0LU66_ACAOB|nr:unnamed protein product [Acanthoscelides obtectus]CAK1620056.1 hypothetical protein AOBTE_LOCUS165 [Acanthoscelides obtectus]
MSINFIGFSSVCDAPLAEQAAAEATNNKQQLMVVFTDCAKAFDKVDDGLLVTKLGRFGFSPTASYIRTNFFVGPNNCCTKYVM